ncbi:peptidoglycan-recognition protein 3-like [Macrosteles quadrilineatus]|uniref:peptidoglycan-recognition protein 3-like n=1 Tax=Macrosteles quadrilineatus TaxID=74068 RepID=UPI0023E337CE|nr:peptidoglycan-recognition protein 3-like [Macrosteles quadrilineatus]
MALKHLNFSQVLHMFLHRFLVGRDGTVYEGRGWSTKSSKSLKFNPALYGRRLDIAFIGDYDTVYNPPLDMLEGSQNIQRLGIEENYLLDGHEIVRIYTWRNRVREGRIGEFPTAEEWLYQKYHPPDEFQLPPILQVKKSWKGT